MREEAGPDRPRRVLHLLWSGRIGGIERQVAAIVRHAAARRAGEHRACFLDGQGTVGEALSAEGLAARLRLRGGWDPAGLLRLARLLRVEHPDIVHSHTHALLPTLVARLALPRAALVYTEHSPRALGRDRKFHLLYRLLRRWVPRFVALAPSMARAMERYGVDPARIAVVPNPSTIPRRPTVPERHQPPVIGVVARLEEQKRVDLLVEVLGELHRRGIESGGLVVGSGTRLPALIEQAGRAGLARAIEFAGERDDVVPWLDQMDVFLMTSAREPFGISALEAMARRVPVVAMPCPGGLSDLVARGGLLLPDRTVEAAASAIGALLRSPALAVELRARGDATVAQHTAERVCADLERVYAACEA